MLPYFAGERTPIFDPRARGVIAGLTLRHSRAHLFRAVYEGIAFGIRQILELLESDINPSNDSSPWAVALKVGSGPRSSVT
jgi:xylulokinase